MPASSGSTYTSDHEVLSDSDVTFACSQDVGKWPWLALPAQHPIVLQTQNFWASVGGSQALGARDDDKWSALTWTRWELGDVSAGRAARGTFARTGGPGELDFELGFFDAQGRPIVRLTGKGVVFRNRNFERWREGSKNTARKETIPPTGFAYAERALLNLTEREMPLIAPLDDSGTRSTALITRENGLMPGHAFFSGSGDHVNATHLAEVGRQTASLLNNGAPIHVVCGEMDMHRYIELGTPFEIAITEHREDHVKLAISQLGRSCSAITMHWQPA